MFGERGIFNLKTFFLKIMFYLISKPSTNPDYNNIPHATNHRSKHRMRKQERNPTKQMCKL